MHLDRFQRWVILGAILVFLAMGFFPPWKYENGEPAGHAFITSGRAQLDFGRLVLQWLLLAGCLGAGLWAAKAFDLSVWPRMVSKWLNAPTPRKKEQGQLLPANSVLEIRFSPASGIWPMLLGGSFAVAWICAFFYGSFYSPKPNSSVGEFFGGLALVTLLAGTGVWIFVCGWKQAFDKRVKLSLTALGFKDHRTGKFFRWTEFRGVRLFIRTTNGHLQSATMYVKVAHDHEIAFEVSGLDRTHDEIGELVQKRGIAA